MTDQTRRDQHRLRAQLRRDGQRVLDQAAITDYRAASYEAAVATEQARITREVHKAREAAVKELLGEPNQPVELGAATLEAIDRELLSFWAPEPEPLPARSRTQQDLLTRLNARHNR